MTLKDRIDELVGKHGSLRAAARVLRMDAAYLLRLRSGEKGGPSNATLGKLGLRKVVHYTYAWPGRKTHAGREPVRARGERR